MPLSSRRLVLAALTLATPALAQGRRALPSGHPQAQLMGYYAAVMEFSPAGMLSPAGRIEVGAEATYIPRLSVSDRLVGFGGTKSENTNFCPVLPRLRAAASLGRWSVELGYVPPVRACGVSPHMVSGAVTLHVLLAPRWELAARASAHYGRLDAPITCGKGDVGDAFNPTCLGGQVSDDRVTPLAFALDYAVTYGGWRARRVEPYVLVGVRREQVDFDVHYVNAGGLLDDQRLGTTLTRVHAAVGAAWEAMPRVRLGGELYYAPGALLTLRTRASYVIGGGR